jgi:hypothetical protein
MGQMDLLVNLGCGIKLIKKFSQILKNAAVFSVLFKEIDLLYW